MTVSAYDPAWHSGRGTEAAKSSKPDSTEHLTENVLLLLSLPSLLSLHKSCGNFHILVLVNGQAQHHDPDRAGGCSDLALYLLPILCVHSVWLHICLRVGTRLVDSGMCWKVCARRGCEALASLTSHCSVSLSLSAGKSHRRDAADSLQQAPLMAVPAPDEEDVKRLWCLQVLWVEKN